MSVIIKRSVSGVSRIFGVLGVISWKWPDVTLKLIEGVYRVKDVCGAGGLARERPGKDVGSIHGGARAARGKIVRFSSKPSPK